MITRSRLRFAFEKKSQETGLILMANLTLRPWQYEDFDGEGGKLMLGGNLVESLP